SLLRLGFSNLAIHLCSPTDHYHFCVQRAAAHAGSGAKNPQPDVRLDQTPAAIKEEQHGDGALVQPTDADVRVRNPREHNSAELLGAETGLPTVEPERAGVLAVALRPPLGVEERLDLLPIRAGREGSVDCPLDLARRPAAELEVGEYGHQGDNTTT